MSKTAALGPAHEIRSLFVECFCGDSYAQGCPAVTSTPPVPAFTYAALITRVIDADTYDVEVQLGFRVVARLPLRLARVDAPERNTTAGQAAIVAVTRLLGPLPCPVLVHTFKPADKYGRYLADVWCGQASIAEYLTNLKLAVPYEGGTKT